MYYNEYNISYVGIVEIENIINKGKITNYRR